MDSVPDLGPGIHRIPDRMYFAIDLPSSSETKVLINGTNAHLGWQRENPKEETEALATGAYLHALLLAPQSIEDDFIVTGRIDRRTRDGKAEWDSVQRRAGLSGARIVTADQAAHAARMATALRENSDTALWINTLTERETTVIAPLGRGLAKAKVDGIIRSAGSCCIVDIKSAASASPTEFAKAAASFGYFHQAAWYSRLVSAVYAPVDSVVLLVVEKDEPHLTAAYRVPTTAIVAADQHLETLADRWRDVAAGDRRGYPSGLTTLEPPSWWLAANEEN